MVYALTSLIGIPLCALTVITWGQYEVYAIKFFLNKSGLIKNNAQTAPPTTEPKPDDTKKEVDKIALQPEAESQDPPEPEPQPRPSSSDLSSSILVFFVGAGVLIVYYNHAIEGYNLLSSGDRTRLLIIILCEFPVCRIYISHHHWIWCFRTR